MIAFIKKEFLFEISYRFSFLLNILGIFAWILTFYFIDILFGSKIAPHLEPYGVNYFPYVILGIAFFTYVGTGVGGFSNSIRNEQLMGTLEALLATPTRPLIVIISLGIWNFLWATIEILIYLTFGIFLFRIDITNINLFSAFIILILTISSFSGLGLIAASFIMVLKRGQPVTWVVNTSFELLGGVYFPISVLPNWLQTISSLLPVTYSIKAIQLAVYKGYTPELLFPEIIALLIFSIILMPLGVLFFNLAVKWAKMRGSLTHY